MIHLGTFPEQQELKCVWLLDEADRFNRDTLDMMFRRIVIGLSLESPLFCCVIGERVLDKKSGQERFFVVLDEYESLLPQEMINKCIELKDRYRCTTLFVPDSPIHLVQSVRETDGLTWYRDDNNLRAAKAIWPSFVDFEVRVALRETTQPDEKTLHRELEHFLTAAVVDTDTMLPISLDDNELLYRLYFPSEMPNDNTKAGVRQAKISPCLALWLAAKGLDRSQVPVTQEDMSYYEHMPNPITG